MEIVIWYLWIAFGFLAIAVTFAVIVFGLTVIDKVREKLKVRNRKEIIRR